MALPTEAHKWHWEMRTHMRCRHKTSANSLHNSQAHTQLWMLGCRRCFGEGGKCSCACCARAHEMSQLCSAMKAACSQQTAGTGIPGERNHIRPLRFAWHPALHPQLRRGIAWAALALAPHTPEAHLLDGAEEQTAPAFLTVSLGSAKEGREFSARRAQSCSSRLDVKWRSQESTHTQFHESTPCWNIVARCAPSLGTTGLTFRRHWRLERRACSAPKAHQVSRGWPVEALCKAAVISGCVQEDEANRMVKMEAAAE